MEETTESLILEALQKEVSLKIVNHYGENLLHVVAANGCSRVVKEILEKKMCDVNRKNVFGWTALMQAIRNRKLDCVQILLNNGANVTESTYLGMSTIGLAIAVGKEMFETVYKFSPAALELAALDEVCPFSITAMKNDKDLFFRLVELGLDPLKANSFAHLMMKSSLIPEISALAKPLPDIESYWNDCTDNIKILDDLKNYDNPEVPITKKKVNLPRIFIYETDAENLPMESDNKFGELNLIIPVEQANTKYKSLISPNLTYNNDGAFSSLLKPILSKEEKEKDIVDNNKMKGDLYFIENCDMQQNSYYDSGSSLRRCQKFRPPDLKFLNEPTDLNATLSFVPEYTPTKSPNVPPEIEDENAVFGETTPTPPHGATPPRAFIFTPKDAPMAFLLHSYGLDKHILTFLEQEVDVELFFTLNDKDLKEIGIESESERSTILSVIEKIKESWFIKKVKI